MCTLNWRNVKFIVCSYREGKGERKCERCFCWWNKTTVQLVSSLATAYWLCNWHLSLNFTLKTVSVPKISQQYMINYIVASDIWSKIQYVFCIVQPHSSLVTNLFLNLWVTFCGEMNAAYLKHTVTTLWSTYNINQYWRANRRRIKDISCYFALCFNGWIEKIYSMSIHQRKYTMTSLKILI